MAFDFAYFVVVLGYVVYLSALGLPTSSQVGLALGLSMNAVVIIAFACILWRYRLKSKDNQRTSVYVLFVLVIVWLIANLVSEFLAHWA